LNGNCVLKKCWVTDTGQGSRQLALISGWSQFLGIKIQGFLKDFSSMFSVPIPATLY